MCKHYLTYASCAHIDTEAGDIQIEACPHRDPVKKTCDFKTRTITRSDRLCFRCARVSAEHAQAQLDLDKAVNDDTWVPATEEEENERLKVLADRVEETKKAVEQLREGYAERLKWIGSQVVEEEEMKLARSLKEMVELGGKVEGERAINLSLSEWLAKQ